MRTKSLVTVMLALLPLSGAISRVRKPEPGGWCCLCMCHAVDENTCARACIQMQHGQDIIEEPQMEACTKSCLQKGVRQIVPENPERNEVGEP